MITVITDVSQLIEGKWYAIGIESFEGVIDWGGAPIYKYEGEGCWTNDYGDEVTTVWDTDMQMDAGINNADGYMPQC